jgi:CTLH/CRA C-terminal to LisH motif domain
MWDTRALRFAAVSSADRSAARCTGRGRHAHDIAAVVSEAPLLPADGEDAAIGSLAGGLVAYFEIEIVSCGDGEEGAAEGGGEGTITTEISLGIVAGGGDSVERTALACSWARGGLSFGLHCGSGRLLGGGGSIDEDDPEDVVPESGRLSFSSSAPTSSAAATRAGDVFGCGVLVPAKEVFFTRNGQFLGKAFAGTSVALMVASGLFAAATMHRPGEAIQGVFPQGNRVLRWGEENAADLVDDFRDRIRARIDEVDSGGLYEQQKRALLRDFLAQGGYAETLAVLGDDDVVTSDAGDGDAVLVDAGASLEQKYQRTLAFRGEIRQLIQGGNIAGARARLETSFPGAVSKGSRCLFLLRMQQFAELVRSGDTSAALGFLRAEIAPIYVPNHGPAASSADGDGDGGLVELAEGDANVLRDTAALLAFPDPFVSPVDLHADRLLGADRRSLVADVANDVVLRADLDLGTPDEEEDRGSELVAQISDLSKRLTTKFGGKSRFPALLMDDTLSSSLSSS